MEIILKKMKQIIISFLLLIISVSSFGQTNKTKQEWISQYKESVIFAGFSTGLYSQELSSKLILADKSFYNPFFKTLHKKAINRGADYLLNLINKDYVDRKGRVTEPADGRRALLICLQFYTSKKLNEIAEQEYIKWIQNPNKKKLMEEVNKIY